MSNLISPDDPQYFKVSSDKPYDRHHYELVLSNGQHMTFESWEEVRNQWFNMPSHFLSHVNVIDRVQKKKKREKAKGF
tara:strand:- start:150 stop:383 length:234 start_codon:yes stop_codon:yes gene_type:complete